MTTRFYSTKRNRKVSVPNSKVCGYRISNPTMKNGYSDGVKASRDNGVVNQPLSRFATERQREDAGSNCDGNVNWLNHRTGGTFQPSESNKNHFSLERNGFKAGYIYNEKKQAQSITDINKRAGQGNFELVRPAFQSSAIAPRRPVDFDKLQALDIANFGQKVQLGQEQLEQLTMVAVPDPLDTKWLDEERRLTRILRANGLSDDDINRELKVNKPLGRAQRTNNVSTKNIARQQGLSFESKVTEIKQEIDNGRVENRRQNAAIVGQLSVLFQNQSNVARLNIEGVAEIVESLDQINISKNYEDLFPRRIIAWNDPFFSTNKGLIAIFFLSNIPADRSVEQPLLSYRSGKQGTAGKYVPAALLQMYQIANTNRFLDMKTRTIESADSLRARGLTLNST